MLFTLYVSLLCLCLLYNVNAWAGTCASKHLDVSIGISQVVDGDTLRLKDGRLLRLVGINSPEIDHQGDNSQPLAKQAREVLKQAIKTNERIGVAFGPDRTDRYGRLLGHAFTSGGTNLQALLLAKGLAAWIAIPPNLGFRDCYLSAEREARRHHRGIWGHPYYMPIRVDDRGYKRPLQAGFRLIKGRVLSVSRRKEWITMQLAAKVRLRIHIDDIQYFADKRFKRYKDRELLVRGWIYPRKGIWSMRIKHADAIEWL